LRAVRSLVRHGGTRVRDAKAALLAMDYPIRTVMPAKAGAKRVGEGSERGGDMPEYAPAPPRAGGWGGGGAQRQLKAGTASRAADRAQRPIRKNAISIRPAQNTRPAY